MLQILLVGMGGFLGSLLRYLFSGWIHRFLSNDGFPYGTLGVNVLGCLLIGFLAGIEEHHGVFTPETRLFIFIGLIGGFTTFSSFAYEMFYLTRSTMYVAAFANIMVELLVGLLAVWIGHTLTR